LLRAIAVVATALLVLAVVVVYGAGQGWMGSHEGPGDISGARVEPAVVASRSATQRSAALEMNVGQPKQILFGDLHVHTTVSFDAFMTSLPMINGEGSRPQADACDFARHCSALDFWSINDHAEGMTPQNWVDTVDSIRECNELAGDPANPDTVAYLGWEWTNVGTRPENHYGHKNVVIRGLADGEIPARPIAAMNVTQLQRTATPGAASMGAFALASGEARVHDLATYFAERRGLEICDVDVPTRELGNDCTEASVDAGDLFARLNDWEDAGVESIVIPHGTSWGFYTPSGSTWDKQLTRAQHDPERQTLVEIYSGHGNSEEYREFRAVTFDADGSASCPRPTSNYLPRCWRAGELIGQRCLDDGESAEVCEERAAEAREIAADAGLQAHLTVPGYDAEEWLDAGQCRDCEVPAFNYRPGGSAQYMMALSNFEEDGEPLRFRFGFMASSDNHKARPGTGYKEVLREAYTESRDRNELSGPVAAVLRRPDVERSASPERWDPDESELFGFQILELERQASFFMTGGLIAAHSEGRDRDSVWEAMQRREVYGTSGPRTLLWFDLLNAPGSRGRSLPMGAETTMGTAPIFQVRAVGSFEQTAGCDAAAVLGLGEDRIERVCAGECYNPSDTRRLITRIEVVRIQPQASPGEPVAKLIEDPWKVFDCEPDPAGCSVAFSDPAFELDGRDTLYYVRAIEEPMPVVNAGGARCTRDAQGNCTEVEICGYRSPGGDCLSEAEPRAWSSPIFVDWAVGVDSAS
jgi:hypothetical protein